MVILQSVPLYQSCTFHISAPQMLIVS